MVCSPNHEEPNFESRAALGCAPMAPVSASMAVKFVVER